MLGAKKRRCAILDQRISTRKRPMLPQARRSGWQTSKKVDQLADQGGVDRLIAQQIKHLPLKSG
jgi:hypothetical protein